MQRSGIVNPQSGSPFRDAVRANWNALEAEALPTYVG